MDKGVAGSNWIMQSRLLGKDGHDRKGVAAVSRKRGTQGTDRKKAASQVQVLRGHNPLVACRMRQWGGDGLVLERDEPTHFSFGTPPSCIAIFEAQEGPFVSLATFLRAGLWS